MSADLEEALYDLVATEIAHGDLKQGLWLKAFAEVQGEKQKAQALYAKLRVTF